MQDQNTNTLCDRVTAPAVAFQRPGRKSVAPFVADAPEAVETAKLKADAIGAYFANEQPTYIVDDAKVGKRLGVSADVIRAYRHRHRIPAFVNRMQNAIDEMRKNCAAMDIALIDKQNFIRHLKYRAEKKERDNKIDCCCVFGFGILLGAFIIGIPAFFGNLFN